jgi:transposase-like protein
MDGWGEGAIVADSLETGANISEMARRHDVARGLLTVWRHQLSSADEAQKPRPSFAAVKIEETSAPEVSRVSSELDLVAGASSRQPSADRDRCRWRSDQSRDWL